MFDTCTIDLLHLYSFLYLQEVSLGDNMIQVEAGDMIGVHHLSTRTAIVTHESSHQPLSDLGHTAADLCAVAKDGSVNPTKDYINVGYRHTFPLWGSRKKWIALVGFVENLLG